MYTQRRKFVFYASFSTKKQANHLSTKDLLIDKFAQFLRCEVLCVLKTLAFSVSLTFWRSLRSLCLLRASLCPNYAACLPLFYMPSICCFLSTKLQVGVLFVIHVKNFVFFVKLCAFMLLSIHTVFFVPSVPLWLIFANTKLKCPLCSYRVKNPPKQ